MTTQPSHGDLMEKLGELFEKFDALDEKVSRIEAKVMAYDRLKERIIGGLMAGSVFIAALWWLTKSKLAAVFGVSAS